MLARHFFLFGCGMVIAGCGAASPPRQVENVVSLPPPAADGTYMVKFPDPGRHVGRGHRLAIGVAEPVQCRFSPHFAFGSAEPLPQDIVELQGFASCLQSELARDKPIEIIGHADAHGSSNQNLRLALARAERVRNILVAQGVEPERMTVRSVGEQDARGFLTAYAHGYDRRVDVALLYEAREPSNRYEVASWR